MRAIVPMAVVLMLAGCASATMDAARSAKPTAQLDSHKAPELVSQCIQFSWQEESVFGVDASGYLEPRKQGGFTVYTREAESFVDVYPQAGGTRVDYYAQKNDSLALQRRAAAATCL
ncbi:hypothetical protein C4Q28_10280 [Pseudomonas sp. SWI6]|uniref:Lipoprotein n=1 Tax=Pseudomonas taiwanensis TaxID=470150 RepID=A0ABR6V0T8_9PSED|nr:MULTISPECIES: hypothetical protein [Pseudomonas]AVD82513.1 hypothetical protein C4Q28_10280 [Pseudomonas sp. SWI6]AVD89468.1 hypothetical protein C4Q26_20985 [Pseudomonas sp. SWI44]MBC3474066.1 hypothetical protein [Pseudomonas taiwanensis]MBC3491452.1 hypothetical protein [Pseudomonas taiwanensis]MDT8924155.1 hypothetical protein [Pseudomonas taiwanensis]